ncbi:MAG TPA: L-serine ammonia-lyase, partial [Paracoccaceae bacterium]|nr:L-serine ammonia-lyase [Paracoccaceae bacterium]
MFLSVFDIFKIGIGPSSSHTMGPMLAAGRFLAALASGEDRIPGASQPARLSCRLHGSLAFTGKGHGTDRAVILGFAGFEPATIEAEAAEAAEGQIRATGRVTPPGLPEMAFAPDRDIEFDYGPPLPLHANGLVLMAHDAAGNLALSETYYSVGGGFVLTAREMERQAEVPPPDVPYPFRTAAEMLRMARDSGLTIAAMKQANELAVGPAQALDAGLDRIWQVMEACIARGLARDGALPGGLRIRRRAKAIHEQLLAERGLNLAPPHVTNDWLSVYAMAVNEENAAGGQVVTAPTNGAAGVVPSVLRYYLDQVPGARRDRVRDFLLTAAAIGGIIKTNASISGAEVGCQGEVGSA